MKDMLQSLTRFKLDIFIDGFWKQSSMVLSHTRDPGYKNGIREMYNIAMGNSVGMEGGSVRHVPRGDVPQGGAIYWQPFPCV